MTSQDQPAAGFVPDRWDANGLLSWVEASDHDFREPFASQTLKRLRESGGSVVTTPWTSLLASGPVLDLSGIIFHMARCGSSWVCQGLRALDRTLVFAEPPVLEGAWISEREDGRALDPILRRAMLQGALSALGRLGRFQGRQVFVKPTPWATESADLLLRAAPRACGVFLFRHPVEVVVSVLESIPGGLRDGEPLSLLTQRLGMTAGRRVPPDRREISALIVRGVMTDALAQRDRIRFVSYESLLTGGLEPLIRFFRPNLSEAEGHRIRAVSIRYSKDPAQEREFVPDGDAKRARADARVWELYEEHLRGPYEECLALSGGVPAAVAV